jgi:hypothetical protein
VSKNSPTLKKRIVFNQTPCFNPDHALGFTGIGLPVENTLISLLRLHSLALGFETFAFWQKAELSRRSTVSQGNPIPVLTKYLGLKTIAESVLEVVLHYTG